MTEILKRLEIIKSSIAIGDEEIIELQVMQLKIFNIDNHVENILEKIEDSNFSIAIELIESYLSKYNKNIHQVEAQIKVLRLELKSLKDKFLISSEEKFNYLYSVEEFNSDYFSILGDNIEEILTLKKEQETEHTKNLKIFEDTKKTLYELKHTISEVKSSLEKTDRNSEDYNELHNIYQELKRETQNLEIEVALQEEKLNYTKKRFENEKFFNEYNDINSIYQNFKNEYQRIKEIQSNFIHLDIEHRNEIKEVYRRLIKLQQLYELPEQLEKSFNTITQSLSYKHSKENLIDLRKILASAEDILTNKYFKDSCNDEIELKEKINEYRLKILVLEKEIEYITNDETFIFLDKIENLDMYFKGLKTELQNKKKEFENEAENILVNNGELSQNFLSTSTIARQHNIQAKPYLFEELIELKLIYKENKAYKLTSKGKKIGGDYRSNEKGKEWIVWEENSLNEIIENLKIKLTSITTENISTSFSKVDNNIKVKNEVNNVQILTSHQTSIYDKVITNINNIFNGTTNIDNIISLSGSAGVGKTFLIIKIIQYLKQNEFNLIVTTPTHKALSVITNSLLKYNIKDIPAKTLHSFLQLKLEIDERTGSKVFVVDEKNKEQNTTNVLIVDESSMIGNDLFNFINESIEQDRIKAVIFVGDPYQLPPVNSEKNTIFGLNNSYFLEEIIRQQRDNYIIEIATRIRDCIINQDFSLRIEEFFQKDFKELKLFTNKDTFLNQFFRNDTGYWYSKDQIIADYTNKSVDNYNLIARERYWLDRGISNPKQIEIDDIVVFQEAVLAGEKVIYQNGSITKVKKVSQKYDNELGLSYWLCEDEYEKEFKIVNHLNNDKYQHMLENKIKEAKSVKKGYEKKIKWTEYYKLKEKYASIKFNYSSTIHKLQGSTYDTVFIDIRKMQNLYHYSDKIEKEFLYRLLYVAVTRASKNINILMEVKNLNKIGI